MCSSDLAAEQLMRLKQAGDAADLAFHGLTARLGRMCGELFDPVGLGHQLGDVVDEVEGGGTGIGQQCFRLRTGNLRNNHEVGTHAFLHTRQTGLKVERQDGTAEEGIGQNADDEYQREGAQWSAR